jgi:aminoglycoside 6'-N-acetyltransferase I
VRIIDLRPRDRTLVRQVARLLVDGFRELEPDAYPDMTAALSEVRQSFGPDRPSRAAVESPGTALGWIGGIRHYRGHAWELHPLVVRPDRQRQGIGRALVGDLEQRVARRGARTIYLGTEDVGGRTSVAGVDLYPDVLGHAKRIRNRRGPPYEFNRKLGFVVVGVHPDANGVGKPDVFMAKRAGP